MNTYAKQILWQKLRDKIDKKEQFSLSEIVWGMVSEGGSVTKESLTGLDKVKQLEKGVEEYQVFLKKSEDELKEKYALAKAEWQKGHDESKAFFTSFQNECKRMKAEVNKTKAPAQIKNGVISLLTSYLESLHGEIQDEKKFPEYAVWKTDKLNVAETQIPYWKTQIKNRTAEAKKNEKDLDKIIAEIPLPEGMKW